MKTLLALSLLLFRCLYKKLTRSSLSLVLLLHPVGVRSARASLQAKVPLGNLEKLHSILPLVYSLLFQGGSFSLGQSKPALMGTVLFRLGTRMKHSTRSCCSYRELRRAQPHYPGPGTRLCSGGQPHRPGPRLCSRSSALPALVSRAELSPAAPQPSLPSLQDLLPANESQRLNGPGSSA